MQVSVTKAVNYFIIFCLFLSFLYWVIQCFTYLRLEIDANIVAKEIECNENNAQCSGFYLISLSKENGIEKQYLNAELGKIFRFPADFEIGDSIVKKQWSWNYYLNGEKFNNGSGLYFFIPIFALMFLIKILSVFVREGSYR